MNLFEIIGIVAILSVGLFAIGYLGISVLGKVYNMDTKRDDVFAKHVRNQGRHL